MNQRYRNSFLPLKKSLPATYFVLACLGTEATLGEPLEQYTANEPLSNPEQNIPSGGGSSFAKVSASGPGAFYQARYYKLYTDTQSGRAISWGGTLDAIFMDEAGRLREDNGIKGKLEDTNVDYIVDIFTDESATPPRTRVQRFQQSGSGINAKLSTVGAIGDLDTLNSIWNARDALSEIPQENILTQRPLETTFGHFAEDAGNKRFIFTYLDVPGLVSTGAVETKEVIDFVPEAFDPHLNDNWRYLGLDDQSEAMNLIRYIRGQDVAGWRTRLIDFPGDASAEEKYWLLGDIVNSAPLAVGAPAERYDTIYGDTTYRKFKDHYSKRRQMIYAGANDGMLHAFNGGVWDAASRSFQSAGHKLGAEMWAYIPMNLLPHLQWLKSPEYSHVYYVDAAPQVFDVNIFADDSVHPGGWGTLLVIGMGFGGADFSLDLDADGNHETTRTSSVIVMDITDPEGPPVLLAELTSPALDFTTGSPALIKARRPEAAGSYASPAMNEWLLVLGSGPEALTTATSINQRPTLFAWNLQTRKYVPVSASLQAPAAEPSGFYGSFAVVDYENDFIDDALYVGTVEGTEQNPRGRLKKISLNASAFSFGFSDNTAQLSTVLDVERPIVAKPTFMHSYKTTENWLLFGTGRSFTAEDYRSVTGQRIFGVKDSENIADAVLDDDSFIDATDIVVQVDAISGATKVWDTTPANELIVDDVIVNSFQDLLEVMDEKNGWSKRLLTNLPDPAERITNSALSMRSSAIFTSYLPGDGAGTQGESFIYALHYRTGTADENGVLGANKTGLLRDAVSAGKTELAPPVLYVASEDEPKPGKTSDATESAGDKGDTVTLLAGDDTGGVEDVDLALPSAVMQRLSWEMLDTSFKGN